jgi:predicted ATPase with chaperone activity
MLARTVADLEGSGAVRRTHVAEAVIYRRASMRKMPLGA